MTLGPLLGGRQGVAAWSASSCLGFHADSAFPTLRSSKLCLDTQQPGLSGSRPHPQGTGAHSQGQTRPFLPKTKQKEQTGSNSYPLPCSPLIR